MSVSLPTHVGDLYLSFRRELETQRIAAGGVNRRNQK